MGSQIDSRDEFTVLVTGFGVRLVPHSRGSPIAPHLTLSFAPPCAGDVDDVDDVSSIRRRAHGFPQRQLQLPKLSSLQSLHASRSLLTF